MVTTKKPTPFKKALYFSEQEFQERRNKALELMKRENLDGFLMTKQESLYYFTGFDTFGYVFFQAMYFHSDGSMRLITRIPDLRQALYTSILDQKDILIRSDDVGSNPVSLVPKVLQEFGINSPSKRIGYEPDSCSLTHRLGKALEKAVEGVCTLVDQSDLFTRELRIIKSETEMRKVRKAAYLADFALVRTLKLAKPGAYEGDLWREIVGTVYEGGGDDPANENILVSGNKAVLTRYSTGKDRIERQLTAEHAAVYKHYHACLMRTIPIGGITKLARRMHEVNVLQMKACMELSSQAEKLVMCLRPMLELPMRMASETSDSILVDTVLVQPSPQPGWTSPCSCEVRTWLLRLEWCSSSISFSWIRLQILPALLDRQWKSLRTGVFPYQNFHSALLEDRPSLLGRNSRRKTTGSRLQRKMMVRTSRMLSFPMETRMRKIMKSNMISVTTSQLLLWATRLRRLNCVIEHAKT